MIVKNLLISSKGPKSTTVPLVTVLDAAESTEDPPDDSPPDSMNDSIASVEEFIDPMLIPPGGSAERLNSVLTIQQ